MKSQDQREALCKIYKRYNGNMPSNAVIDQLAIKLDLKANQIYKWFWNRKKSSEHHAQLACQLKITQIIPLEDGFQKTNYRDETGKRLTLTQVKKALRIN